MSWNYISKVGAIYVVTLTSAWQEVLTEAQCKSIRGMKVKARMNPGEAPGSFDIAFSATPNETGSVTDGTGYLSFTGSGFGDVFSPSSGLYARTRSGLSVVLEIISYL